MAQTRYSKISRQLSNALTERHVYTLTANGTTPPLRLGLDLGMVGTMTTVSGNYGGGSLAHELSFDGVNWFTHPNITAMTTGSSLRTSQVTIGEYFRFNLTGATSPSLTVNFLAPSGGGENVRFDN